MPKLKKVIAGLALSTALGGGALAAGATAASASTAPTGWGCTNPCTDGFNNTFENVGFRNEPFQHECFRNECSRNECSRSDLDDILWDVCVAGHCSNVLPELVACVN
ncbi:hypothetical protein [Microbispora siamensis]|uniref:Secreted protein n=1 Tax=Microbispora siamensis TaxID=564413 RepID=A0ABQ4GSC1_9ACTN|nr:hypothetical protein [Microbispora siamensis]GIH64325.1 hypothetical protein Msi02_51420 [Microbispora siamensis]